MHTREECASQQGSHRKIQTLICTQDANKHKQPPSLLKFTEMSNFKNQWGYPLKYLLSNNLESPKIKSLQCCFSEDIAVVPSKPLEPSDYIGKLVENFVRTKSLGSALS
jgi:hypothetical protein